MGPIRSIIPARALSELARVIGDGDETVSMSLPPNRGQVIFRAKDVELVSQLIEGTFPDYQGIIPSNYSSRSVLSTNAFLKACKAADIFARESAHSARIRITPGSELEPGIIEAQVVDVPVVAYDGGVEKRIGERAPRERPLLQEAPLRIIAIQEDLLSRFESRAVGIGVLHPAARIGNDQVSARVNQRREGAARVLREELLSAHLPLDYDLPDHQPVRAKDL